VALEAILGPFKLNMDIEGQPKPESVLKVPSKAFKGHLREYSWGSSWG